MLNLASMTRYAGTLFFLAVAVVGCSRSPEQLSKDLFEAAKQGNASAVKELISAGADPNDVYTSPGQSGTRISLKPLVVAQANLSLAQSLSEGAPFHLEDPADDRRLRDPNAVHNYEAVIQILQPLTKN